MNHDEEIIFLRGEVATLKANVENLVGWQHTQNGAIHEVREDVSKLKYWLMGATLMVALNLSGVIFMVTTN